MAIRDRITQFVTYLVKQIKCSQGGILIGRVTGEGKAQEITVGSGLTLSGTTLTVTGGTFAAASHTHVSSSITDAVSDATVEGSEGKLLKTANDGSLSLSFVFADSAQASDMTVGSVGTNGVLWILGNGSPGGINNANQVNGLQFSLPTTSGNLAVTDRTDGAVSYNDLVDVPAAVPLTSSKSVANAAARLALTLEQSKGFAVVDADTGKTWMLVAGGTPATSSDWLQLGDRDIQWGDVGGKPSTFTPDVSAIADGALSIAKTSGLQTALDGKVPSLSGPFHNDYDAANGNIAIGSLYKAVDGSTKWRATTFHPMTLNPGLWLDASQLALSNGASVTSVTDLSGNSRTATNSGTAPTFETSGPNSMPWIVSNARTLVTPSFDHWPSKRGTWFVVYRPDSTTTNQTFFGSYNGGTTPAWVFYANNESEDRYLYANAFATSPTRLQGDLAGEVVVRAVRRTSDTGWDWWRGPLKQWSPTLADVSLASNPLKIGQSFIGRIGEVVFYPVALTDAQVEQVSASLTRKWTGKRPVNLCFEGDSQTVGVNIANTNDQSTFPAKTYAALGRAGTSIRNAGVSGSTWSTLTARASTIDDCISPYAQNILVVWCGTNEAYANDAATSLASASSYLAARKAAGWNDIIVIPAMDRTDQHNETWRTAYNTGLQNLCSYFGYSFANITADSRIGASGAYSNTTYFQVDGIHINSEGARVAAEVVQPVISALIVE